MPEIKTTGHEAIDTATADIALALGDRYPEMSVEALYKRAERLRDAIMEGTRELDADTSGQPERAAQEEFSRTGAVHTHVARSGNRVTRPGSRCPGAMCYAMAVNEIDDEAAHVIREGR